jgi:hypothetical protein
MKVTNKIAKNGLSIEENLYLLMIWAGGFNIKHIEDEKNNKTCKKLLKLKLIKEDGAIYAITKGGVKKLGELSI